MPEFLTPPPPVKGNNVDHNGKIWVVIGIIILIFGGLLFRLYDIQVNQHEELFKKARARYITSVKERALRGSICFVGGNPIASDEPYYSITVSPANFPPVEKECAHEYGADPYRCPKCKRDPRTILRAASFFAKNLQLNAQTLEKKFSKTARKIAVTRTINGVPRTTYTEVLNQYDMVLKEINYDDGKKLLARMKNYIRINKDKAKSKEGKIKEDFSKAFHLEVRYRRTYLRGRLLSNLVGYVNINNEKATGQSGLEKSVDHILKPKDGKHTFEKTVRGKFIGIDNAVNEHQAAVPGSDVFLTISEPIQEIIESELDAVVSEYHPLLAYCIVADPKTGNILGMAQRPTYNPNDRGTYSGNNMQNLMAENIYEPGSTMKPLPIAIAIDEGIVSPQSNIDCERGCWIYGGKPLRDCHPYGILTVEGVIQKSSNVGTAKIALMLGNNRLDEAYRNYGFGKRTDIPVRPESRGIYLPLRRWSKLTPSRICIGQGISVTPFQMIRAYCALANNGLLPQLRIIDRITEYDGLGNQITRPYETPPAVQMFKHPDVTCYKMKEMMKKVCMIGGTATRGEIPGYYTAGKTGTAQKVINGQYSNSKHVANFIGFAPADNPRFVMLVAIDEPKGNQYGGIVAAPVFAKAGARILKYMQVLPDYEIGSEKDPFNTKRQKIIAENPTETPFVHMASPTPLEAKEDPDGIFAAADKDNPSRIPVFYTFDENDQEYLREVKNALDKVISDSNAETE